MISYSFLLTLLAGLATGLGGLVVILFQKINEKFLSVSLGFSAGVMIYISFAEILSEAIEKLETHLGLRQSFAVSVLSFFAGVLVVVIIERLVPDYQTPREGNLTDKKRKLLKTAFLTTFAIVLHNFPEGIAAFVTGTVDHTLGAAVAGAIAIHNIPEGIAVAMPVYFATGNKGKAMGLAVLSGLAEPLGAVLAYLILYPILTPAFLGVMLAFVAGVMVFISFDELLPAAREYGEHPLSLWGLFGGMAVMAAGIWSLMK